MVSKQIHSGTNWNTSLRFLWFIIDLKHEYIVIGKNPPEVQGPFDDIENAKNALIGITNKNGGSRMIIEIINGSVQDSYDGVHFINGQEQTQSNGFNQYWQDWHDITDMINIYRQKISGRCMI